jgi:hypothetical protein
MNDRQRTRLIERRRAHEARRDRRRPRGAKPKADELRKRAQAERRAREAAKS